MISNFQIRKDATVPFLEVQMTKDGRVPLYQAAQAAQGNAVDLTGASIAFSLVKAGRINQPVATVGTAEIVDSASGIVRYKWGATDTAVPGLYYATFTATFSSGLVFSWPYQPEALSIEVL